MTGRPLTEQDVFSEAVQARFWPKVDRRGENECWPWTACKTSHGYGLFWNGQVDIAAHRYVYELLVGPIPDGLQLDHLCRMRHCVNPAHLEPVTRRENILRGESFAATNARKTHCTHGHALIPENVYRKRTGRNCRICTDAATRARRERTRAVLASSAEEEE